MWINLPSFYGNALVLSGLLGTKLKSDVLGQYYNFWWRITSGGPSKNFQYMTSIVELNAGTGEVHIKDINTTILGSAGHALDLKIANIPDTRNLKIVLIENHDESYANLKKVIGRRWPEIDLNEIEGPFYDNRSKIYLLKTSLEDAIRRIQVLHLGNSIFFFDPLRSVEWTHIETIATERIRTFYESRTEFLIFLFTSDWFLGRDDFTALPTSLQEDTWTAEERKSVLEADSFFGDTLWREDILNEKLPNMEDKEKVRKEEMERFSKKWGTPDYFPDYLMNSEAEPPYLSLSRTQKITLNDQNVAVLKISNSRVLASRIIDLDQKELGKYDVNAYNKNLEPLVDYLKSKGFSVAEVNFLQGQVEMYVTGLNKEAARDLLNRGYWYFGLFAADKEDYVLITYRQIKHK